MRDVRRTAACARALWLSAALLLSPGCTLYDEYAPGEPFTPTQPEGSVTLVGEINGAPIVAASDGCAPGGTVFWGLVSNTGDLDVTNVSISITVFGASGGSLGVWSGPVYNGEVETIETGPDSPPIDVAGTSLEVDTSGSFSVCTTVPYGSAARTEYRTSFTEVEGTE